MTERDPPASGGQSGEAKAWVARRQAADHAIAASQERQEKEQIAEQHHAQRLQAGAIHHRRTDFPATQTCEKGVERWSELPAADGHALKNPAPVLTVTPTPVKPSEPAMPGMKM